MSRAPREGMEESPCVPAGRRRPPKEGGEGCGGTGGDKGFPREGIVSGPPLWANPSRDLFVKVGRQVFRLEYWC